MKRVLVLGSTGSVGTQALDVAARRNDLFEVVGLSAWSNAKLLEEQTERFGCNGVLASSDPSAVVSLIESTDADLVVNAIVGSAGLAPTLAALGRGINVALANKESCVAGGELVKAALARSKASLIPIDSEHAAVHMCLAGEAAFEKIVLTASGGPLRDVQDLSHVTPKQALAHPTWQMGPRITIDSATLMNKGFEVIEACVLFGAALNQVEVVVHPQSVIHCLVGFADGSWKASLSPPDMRVPIAYAMGWPQRTDWGAETMDWTEMSDLTFEAPDTAKFRCLSLAYEAAAKGGVAAVVLNAADEIAVEAFLAGRIKFTDIPSVVEGCLDQIDGDGSTLGGVLEADQRARDCATRLCRVE